MIDSATFGTGLGAIQDPGKVIAVLSALVLFGIIYNGWIAEQGRNGKAEGMTSLHVAVGAGATLFGLAILWWQAAIVALLCFCASGAPMIYGSINRHLELRSHYQKELIHDITATVAKQRPVEPLPSPESI
jgi:hypothetical protein